MSSKLIFDTETTGLDLGDRIVQLSYEICDEKGNVLKQANFIIKPDNFIINNSHIHGITTKISEKDGIPIKDALTNMSKDVELYNPDTVVAHNIDFDLKFLRKELKTCGMPDFTENLATFCTMKRSTDICKIPRYAPENGGYGNYGYSGYNSAHGYKWPKLAEAYTKITGKDVTVEKLHNAVYDVQLCREIYYSRRKWL